MNSKIKNEEIKLLLEIDDVYKELMKDPKGKLTGVIFTIPSGINYCNNAKVIKKKVLELFNKYSPEYLSEHTLQSIVRSCDKEILYRGVLKIKHL